MKPTKKEGYSEYWVNCWFPRWFVLLIFLLGLTIGKFAG